MGLNVGELYASLGLDTKPFERSIDGSTGKLSKLGSAAGSVISKVGSVLKTTAKVGAIAVTGMGASLAYVGTKYNNLEQGARASFKTILGTSDAANQMMSDIAEFGSTSPFPRQAFIQGTQQLLGFGLEAKKVIPTLGAIQDAVAATGGGAEQIESITFALAQVQGSGKLTGETLNQLGQYGIDAASIIGGEMGKTSNEIRDLASKPGGIPADKVFDKLVGGLTKKFGGAAANVKETWAGAVDRIKGAWRDMGSDLMEPMISKAGGGMAVDLANTFATSLRDVQKKILPFISATVAQVGGAITPILNDVMGQFTSMLAPVMAQLLPVIAPIAEQLGGVFLDVLGALMPVLPVIAQFVAELATALASGLGAAMSSLAPVLSGLVQTLSGALLSVLQAIAPAIPPIIQFIGQLAATFATGLASAIEAVAPVLAQIAWVLGGTLVAAMDAITPLLPLLSTLFANIAATVGKVLLKAFQALAPVLPPLIEAFAEVAGIVGDALLDVLDALAPVLPVLARAFGQIAGVLADVFLTALEALEPVLPVLVDAFGQLLQAACDLWAAAGPALLDLAKALGTAIVDAITELAPMLPGLVDAFMQLVDTLATALIPILPALVDMFTSLLPVLVPLLPPLTSLATTLVELLAKVPPGAIQAIVTAFIGFKALKAATGPVTALAGGIGKVVSVGKGLAGMPGMIASLAKTSGVSNLTAAFRVFKSTLAETKVGQIALAAATKIAQAAQWLWNAAMSANPIGLIVAGIAALIAGLVLAYNKVGWFRDFVDAAFGLIKDIVMAVVDFFVENWTVVGEILMAPIRLAKTVITGAFNGIKSAVSAVFNWVKDNWPLLLAILTGPIGLAVLAIVKNWDTIKNAFTAVKDWISEKVGNIVGFITGIPGRITGKVGEILEILKKPFRTARDWISDRIDDIVGFVEGMKDGIKTALTSVKDTLTAPFTAALEAIKSLWNSTIGGRSIGFTVPDVIGVPHRGEYIGVTIPELHSGGKVPGGPGNEPIFRLQGGELVLSRKEVAALERSAASSTAGLNRRLATVPPGAPVGRDPGYRPAGHTTTTTRGDVTGIRVDHMTIESPADVEAMMRQAEFMVRRGKL